MTILSKNQIARYFQIFVIVMILFVLAVLVPVWVRQWRSTAETPVDSASISIPVDLKSRFDSDFDQYKKALADIDRLKPELEQIMRITLDRSGVSPSEFSKWQFDEQSRTMKKK
jgi:hypothetical protein